MSIELRERITATLAADLNKRLLRLSEERQVPVERLLDKSVEMLLDYMEDQEANPDHIKIANVELINRNREIILQNREMLKKD